MERGKSPLRLAKRLAAPLLAQALKATKPLGHARSSP
jgi:hypothetical protein